ncbi:MFS multidrug-resistance DHA1 sub-family [Suillus discolor]|uniref:MFS multidrug-resistance DHA1 sub-family n=1 Tax=Suillus discolor TaxID=1912936 RepID=A0A9P7FA39_9AGAM|nr:MFS multidrug-resistance DHA1 sub-family [Suillus discolor]KAG2111977.1 MFS multidrug-resistance DHA1 sub-family [Suillus discolor]
MIPRQDNEETSLLLQPEQLIAAKTPLPWDQFWIILVLHFSQSLVFKTLAPFIPRLIKDIGVTNGDEQQVGYYVSFLDLSYYIPQTLVVLYWSRLSDRIGRKPVILTASFAIATTMISFGLSKTFRGLLVSRVICGAFNGESGVIKSMMMDITDATNLPKAYGYVPLPSMLAAIIGPLVGGSLSQPADRFPEIFGQSELLKTYPYLLACAVPALCSSILWLVMYFRLKESVSTKAPFLEMMKQWLSQRSYTKQSALSRDTLISSSEANTEEVLSKSLSAILTPKVLTVAASSGTLTLFLVAINKLLPLFYTTPIEFGGVSLDPPRIGVIFATAGFASGIFQFLFYARLHDRLGAHIIYMVGLGSSIPVILLFPVINALARAHGMSFATWLAIGVQHVLIIILDMCAPCIALFTRAAAPNRASIGATNGVVQLVSGAARIIAPVCAASFSYSMQEGRDAWLAYYFYMGLAFFAIGTSLALPRDPSLWQERD